jgi:hypothetical protein
MGYLVSSSSCRLPQAPPRRLTLGIPFRKYSLNVPSFLLFRHVVFHAFAPCCDVAPQEISAYSSRRGRVFLLQPLLGCMAQEWEVEDVVLPKERKRRIFSEIP